MEIERGSFHEQIHFQVPQAGAPLSDCAVCPCHGLCDADSSNAAAGQYPAHADVDLGLHRNGDVQSDHVQEILQEEATALMCCRFIVHLIWYN